MTWGLQKSIIDFALVITVDDSEPSFCSSGKNQYQHKQNKKYN
jgi:hypothetical protein